MTRTLRSILALTAILFFQIAAPAQSPRTYIGFGPQPLPRRCRSSGAPPTLRLCQLLADEPTRLQPKLLDRQTLRHTRPRLWLPRTRQRTYRSPDQGRSYHSVRSRPRGCYRRHRSRQTGGLPASHNYLPRPGRGRSPHSGAIRVSPCMDRDRRRHRLASRRLWQRPAGTRRSRRDHHHRTGHSSAGRGPHLHPIALWVYQDTCPPSNGCILKPPPLGSSGTQGAEVWQYAQSPRRRANTVSCAKTYASDGNCYAADPAISSLILDLNVASTPDPSQGR